MVIAVMKPPVIQENLILQVKQINRDKKKNQKKSKIKIIIINNNSNNNNL